MPEPKKMPTHTIKVAVDTSGFQADVDAIAIDIERFEALVERAEAAMERLGTSALRAAAKRGIDP